MCVVFCLCYMANTFIIISIYPLTISGSWPICRYIFILIGNIKKTKQNKNSLTRQQCDEYRGKGGWEE